MNKTVYKVVCKNRYIDPGLFGPVILFDSKEKATEHAIKMEKAAIDKYIGRIGSEEYMEQFAKKFWSDNFVIRTKVVSVADDKKVVKEEKMNLREEILKKSGLLAEAKESGDYDKYLVSKHQLKSAYNAYLENKGKPFGDGINWTMEELFGLYWKDLCK